jgi:hypothetical protein
MGQDDLKGMTDEELFDEMGKAISPNTYADRANVLLRKRLFDKLTETINKNSLSSDRLSKRMLHLTYVVTFATIAGVVISIIELCKH